VTPKSGSDGRGEAGRHVAKSEKGKTSRNGENFEEWQKLRVMTKTSISYSFLNLKTSRNDENFEK